jgi:diadenosine tetraphosphatase ApaH/serine/threonine PP2A family protein phosphatase
MPSKPDDKAERPSTDWRDVHGPFDIIGDVHGCADELIALLGKLGYSVRLEGTGDSRRTITTAPKGRRAFFVGDLVDRGPNSPDVLRIVMDMAERGQAFSVIGNHDDKFRRFLKGRDVKLAHGLERTVEQYASEGEALRTRTLAFLETLPSHAWVDAGRLAVAHAGVRENMLGRSSPRVHDFALYGDTSGGVDAAGLPERFNWAADYHGKTTVVYGHTPVAEPEWVNNTVCIDTGCVFGGQLSALRWPERELVSVPAREAYAPLRRGFGLPPVRPAAEAKP